MWPDQISPAQLCGVRAGHRAAILASCAAVTARGWVSCSSRPSALQQHSAVTANCVLLTDYLCLPTQVARQQLAVKTRLDLQLLQTATLLYNLLLICQL